MKASRLTALAVIALGVPAIAQGDVIATGVDINYFGYSGATALFRADLTGFDVGTIRAVSLLDAGSLVSSGDIFSGYDLDFIVFDRDGDLGTTDDQILPQAPPLTFVIPGVITRPWPGGNPPYSAPGPLFGLLADSSIDPAKSTLDARDAVVNFSVPAQAVENSHGWVSIGDGGIITAGFPLTSVGPGQDMFLFVGEVGPPPGGGNPAEECSIIMEVQAVVGADFVPVVAGPGSHDLEPGQWVNLDGNPPGGSASVESWLWDLDNDGQYDDGTGPVLTVSFEDMFVTFGPPQLGPHPVGLLIIREDDQQEEHPFNVNLIPEPAACALIAAILPCLLRRRRRH